MIVNTTNEHLHITDHLGSVRAVLNQSMTVIEQNDYYPFGLRHPNSALKTTANRYRYNGKEEIAADATSDYGARQYSAEFCQWLQVDPLAEKRFGLSPYNFCSGNPINRVDSDGLLDDDYGLSVDGTISLLQKTNDITDKLIVLNNKGKEPDKTIELEKGILNDIKSATDSRNTNYNYIKIGNNKTAIKLFEFLSENSQVEWSLVSYGTKSANIATSHNSSSESGGVDIMYKLLNQNYTVNEHIHSHPNRETSYYGPSGFHPKDGNSGDRELGKWLHNYYPNKGIKLKVYETPLKKYIEYNHKAIKQE